MGRQWPFVGRETEMDSVQRAVADGKLAGAVLVGPPGVGKTRLARRAAQRAEADGALLRWAMATNSASGIPLGAMSHLLSSWQDPGVHAASLLPQAARHLTAEAEGRRVVLVVDDAHLLDPTSAVLVHHLAVSGAAAVIVTVRSGVGVPDPIFGLWKEGLAERVDIHRLDRAQSDGIVRQVLGGRVDDDTLRQLWELSLGNTLFLRELVDGGLASGALDGRGGWRWTGPIVPSPRLSELIDSRMGALEPAEQTVLELLAFGEPLGTDVMDHCADPGALDGLERKGLIASDGAQQGVELRLAHPLYGEVIRMRTSPRREKDVQRELAESIERSGLRRAGDRLRAVNWRIAAGLPADADMLQVAAEETLRVDRRAAEALVRAAVDGGGGYPASFVLGGLLTALGRADEAEELFAGLWFRADTAERRYQLAVTRVSGLHRDLGRPQRAATVLQDALAEPPPAGGASAYRTLEAALLPRPAGAPDVAALATGLLRDAVTPTGGTDAYALEAVAVASAAMQRVGRHTAVRELGERVRETVQPLPAPGFSAARAIRHLEVGHVEALVQGGWLAEAERLGLAGYRAALDDDLPAARSLHAGWLGITYAVGGRIRTALRWLQSATAGHEPGALPVDTLFWTGTVYAAGLLREHEVAVVAGRQVRRALAEGGTAYAPWAGLATVWVDAQEGRVQDAVQGCLATAHQAGRDGLLPARLTALHTVVRLGAAAVGVEELAEAADGVEGPLAPLLAEHGRAAGKGDGAALDEVAGELGELGATLYAAEASAQAAFSHRSAGDRAAGNSSALRAEHWTARCDGVVTPALSLTGPASDLTPREIEIAMLAASGKTSRAIADDLVVSVRTVDNALYSVYGKLGLSGRQELASVIVPSCSGAGAGPIVTLAPPVSPPAFEKR